MQELSKVHHLPTSLDAPTSVDSSKASDHSVDSPMTSGPSEMAGAAGAPKMEEVPQVLDQRSAGDRHEPLKSLGAPRGPASAAGASSAFTGFPKKALLLAVCIVGGILAFATGNFGLPGDQSSLEQKLEGARALLAATSDELKATQAKLAAEQTKGAMAEKALTDIKAVLAKIPADAAAAGSAQPAVQAKTQPPR
jgi:hypothetical protein